MKPKLHTGMLRRLGVTLLCIWSLGPIVMIILSSFRPERDIFSPARRFVLEFTTSNYTQLFVSFPQFVGNMGNSLIVAIGATALAVITSTLAGFVYSRQRGKILAASAFFAILIRLVPPVVVSLPLFPIADALHLSDTHILLIILYSTFWVSMLSVMMKTFIDQIPTTLDEAARVDGAGTFQIFLKIVLPLSITGMIAGGIFVFVFAWNEYLFAFIFTSTYAVTGPVVVSNIMDSVAGTQWGVLFAAATLQLAPVLALVIIFQKYLIAGLMAGSVKG
ncbi:MULTISPECIES: carbohydrate ABC transporter permease [unclassified Chelatococcus]|jgi:multiple sugar transport system permease protein|uniref:carbohydrate ABC transporter permease n=1 Tax=unclassified Chelatococcus TaxID=2638111 RepID=UPI001BCEB87F|nr:MULTISPECIES: carbohydrate ABC transporter permease [unclassified Chelatococcus]CAH1657685.1 Carbohydrate ABC transporter permease [Hyphomicrobiales bacterium]MBS7742276.1 carbohydrate ABC transporter permease [Chelatococcus sp. HY11]MBX3542606.1 carbohydrate ABC transporter permease [Chelatococcus sp.]MCO5075177.1 carbohydrate ABC transporter permease [Chelatococcus sp.]CAH1689273.1 Carbohydrate ABC transporter permease [Hyphomicrobiales bacterium]